MSFRPKLGHLALSLWVTGWCCLFKTKLGCLAPSLMGHCLGSSLLDTSLVWPLGSTSDGLLVGVLTFRPKLGHLASSLMGHWLGLSI